MLTLIALTAALATAASEEDLHIIKLDEISVEDAKMLEGQLVRSTFVIAAPPDTQDEITYIGCELDDVERVVHLPENLLLDKGHEVTIEGVLQVITHPPARINGQNIPACVEIRVVDARLLRSSRDE